MAREAALILETLDRHLRGPCTIRLLGGGAMTLAYGMARTTEDVDLLQDDAEVQVLIDQAEFGEALTNANTELEPRGLSLTHIADVFPLGRAKVEALLDERLQGH